jgi:hypothetical protein
MAAIVQFPHPGDDHVPTGAVMDWNTGPHKRKFLACPGRYVDEIDDAPTSDDLVFWGEWEHGHASPRGGPDDETSRPCSTHRTGRRRRSTARGRTPTRGSSATAFSTANCKQHTNNTPHRQPSALQSLPVGSMILLGSARFGGFVIDTVFIVRDKLGTFRPFDDTSHLQVGAAFDTCTLQPLTTYEPHIGASTYSLYRGATIDEPVHGMFSFVPCRVHGDPGMRFAGPAAHLPDIVNPASRQSPSGATPKDSL